MVYHSVQTDYRMKMIELNLKIEEGKALWERAFEYAVKEWNRRADNE